MRILILCSSYTNYVTQLWNEMQKRYCDIEYSLFTAQINYEKYSRELVLKNGGKIYTFDIDIRYSRERKVLNVRKAAAGLPHFDIMHSLWNEAWWGVSASILRNRTDAWLASVGGSDLYRESKVWFWRALQKHMLKYCCWYSAENQQTIDYFRKIFHEKKFDKIPMTINRFGVDILDEFTECNVGDAKRTKDHFKIPDNKIIVVCGYNANIAHQHYDMINQISSMDNNLKDKCCFIFPMTYCEQKEGYIDSVDKLLCQHKLSYIIIRRFMTTKEMAQLISVSDIMIHVQTTDQMSSTMLANMYAEKIVIAGKWLPYGILKKNGVFFREVDDVNSLSTILSDTIENIDGYNNKCFGNKKKIYSLSSWKFASEMWDKVYLQMRG